MEIGFDTDEWPWVDETQAPFHAFIQALSVASEPMVNEATGEGLCVESLRVTLSFELDVRVGDDGRVHLAGSPPTQHIETSIMPVFHQLGLNVTNSGLVVDPEATSDDGDSSADATSGASVRGDG